MFYIKYSWPHTNYLKPIIFWHIYQIFLINRKNYSAFNMSTMKSIFNFVKAVWLWQTTINNFCLTILTVKKGIKNMFLPITCQIERATPKIREINNFYLFLIFLSKYMYVYSDLKSFLCSDKCGRRGWVTGIMTPPPLTPKKSAQFLRIY